MQIWILFNFELYMPLVAKYVLCSSVCLYSLTRLVRILDNWNIYLWSFGPFSPVTSNNRVLGNNVELTINLHFVINMWKHFVVSYRLLCKHVFDNFWRLNICLLDLL